MYFEIHPVKVILLNIGQIQRKIRYIRVIGDDIDSYFANFFVKLRHLVSFETNTQNFEFHCYWIDSVRDEIEIRDMEDFWCWLRFLESNGMFLPEVVIKPIFINPMQFPYMQPVMRQPAIQFNGPRPHCAMPNTMFRPNAQPFYPNRFQQIRETPPPIQQNEVSVENGVDPPPESVNEDSVATLNGQMSSLELLMSRLTTKQKECLQKLKDYGFREESGWLIQVVETVDGDFERAMSVINEDLDNTDDHNSDDSEDK